MAEFNSKGRVVVGIDGSPASDVALEWAANEAMIRHAVLEIVYVWSLPNMGYGGFVAQLDDFEKDAKVLLDDVEAGAKKRYPTLKIEAYLLQGPPAPAHIERGKLADLLVVGSRGHGGFTGLMLGSVSQQLVHHAVFPIVVIHPPQQ